MELNVNEYIKVIEIQVSSRVVRIVCYHLCRNWSNNSTIKEEKHY